MAKFVNVVNIENGKPLEVALNSVRKVHREDQEERASIIEDYNGHLYECVHEYLQYPKLADCIVER